MKELFPTEAIFTVETLPEGQEGKGSYRDKANWLPGPWDKEEYDGVSWVDPGTGFKCRMLRGPMGSWCGYVGIPKTHPWHGIKYSGCVNRHEPKTLHEKRQEADVLLGNASERYHADPSAVNKSALNMAQLNAQSLNDKTPYFRDMPTWDCLDYDKEDRCDSPKSVIACHGGLTFSGKLDDTETHYFGFDCAHSGDLTPGQLSLSREMKSKDPESDLWTDHTDYDPIIGAITRYGLPETYRDVSYVKGEVERLAKQLKEKE